MTAQPPGQGGPGHAGPGHQHLAAPQPAPFALPLPGGRDRGDAHAHETLHVAPDGLEQPPHLALATLTDRHPQPAPPLAPAPRDLAWRRGVPCRMEPGRPVLEGDPGSQASEAGPRRGRIHERRVLALVAVPRMEDSVRPFAVVRQDHQALGLDVQPPRRPQALTARVDEAHHRPTSALVTRRAEEAARLVDGEVNRRGGRPERPPVDLDAVSVRVGDIAQRGAPAVDADPTVDDELLRTPSRGEPGAGDELLEPLTGHRQRRRGPSAARHRSTAAGAPRWRSARSARGT